MNTPLRVGLIGAGFIADSGHMPGIATYQDATAAAACDTDRSRLAAFAEKWHTPFTCTSWRELIDSGEVDVVSVCLPNALHAEVTEAALAAGLHVMCEKPMALTTADADRMAAMAAASGKLLAIKVHNRYRRSALQANALIDGGMLGEVYQAEVRFHRRAGIPGIGSWFTQRRLAGGGALADYGIHGLDAAMWLLGSRPVTSVLGATSDRLGKAAARGEAGRDMDLASHAGNRPREGTPVFDVEDSAFGLVRLAGDASLSVAATWAGARDDSECITVVGTRGGVTLDWSGDRDALHYLGPTPDDDRHWVFDPRDDGGLGPWSAAHVRSTHAFLDAIVKGEATPVEPSSVAAVMHIIDAIYTSAETGHEVSLQELT